MTFIAGLRRFSPTIQIVHNSFQESAGNSAASLARGEPEGTRTASIPLLIDSALRFLYALYGALIGGRKDP